MKAIGFFDKGSCLANLSAANEGSYVFCDESAFVYKVENDYVGVKGNIFNVDELKMFVSEPCTTIPELIYKLIKKYGGEILSLIDGEFVIIAYVENDVFIIKDRLGSIVPIYFNDSLFFTNPQLLHKYAEKAYSIEPSAVIEFLETGFVRAPQSLFKGFKKLAPGEFLHYNRLSEKLSIKQSSTFKEFKSRYNSLKLPFNDAVKLFDILHKKAIEKRIANKKNVGLLLSGGYDSTGNLANLREVHDGDINAFTVAFDNNPWSEHELARVSAKKYNAKLTEIVIKGNDLDELPNLVKAFPEPFNENGLLLNYFVSKHVANYNPDIILGGDGSDQIFGTTGRELAYLFMLKKYKLLGALPMLKSVFGVSSFLKSFENKVNQIENALVIKGFGLQHNEVLSIMNQEVNSSSKDSALSMDAFASFEEMYIYRNYFSDIQVSAAQVINFKASQLAGYFNFPITYPYFDNDIYHLLRELPVNFKQSGTLKELLLSKGESKYILKQAFKDKLPDEIIHRKKQGGFVPLDMFLNDYDDLPQVKAFTVKVLKESGMFKQNELTILFDQLVTIIKDKDAWFWHRQRSSAKFINLLVLALWWEQNINLNVKNSLKEYF